MNAAARSVDPVSPPIILQDLQTFGRRMEEAWRDDAFRPPAGCYTLNDAIVCVTYTENRYGLLAKIVVVEHAPTYP